MKAKYPWGEHAREEYLLMIDRNWPFWSAVNEFVLVNGIKSVVEVGCGIGQLCHWVDSYTGIDLNQTVLTNNDLFYRRGTWICGDWLEWDGLPAELFLAATVLEHMKSPETVLEKVLKMPGIYAVMTFPVRMRATIQAFLEHRCSNWHIYDLPLSRRPRQAKQVSVLVIDRTGVAQLDMWSKRALNVES